MSDNRKTVVLFLSDLTDEEGNMKDALPVTPRYVPYRMSIRHAVENPFAAYQLLREIKEMHNGQ